MDWKNAEKMTLPNLKPSIKTISLRLPQSMLEELKLLANKKDVPYFKFILARPKGGGKPHGFSE